MVQDITLRLLLYSLIAIGCAASKVVQAQVYIDEGKNRYTFAQTTVGYDMDFTPSGGSSYQYKDGSLQKFKYGSGATPVITITGLHFWGHVEFFTGFSLPTISTDQQGAYFSRSAGTGAKIFPLQITKGGLRPYFGSSVATFSYKKDEGTKYKRVEFPIHLGLTYSFKRGLLELGLNYYTALKHNYYISKTERVPLNTPPVSFCIDYKYFFDTSLGSYKRELSGENQTIYEKLKSAKRLSTFSLAAGPAYSFFTGRSSYNETARPYLDHYVMSNVFPDFGIGYYNYSTDMTVNLSYRFLTTKLKAFDVQQSVMRKSIALEIYKFFADYHGFAPFIGPILSREFIQVNEYDNGIKQIDKSYNFWTPGIIIGWDVRPTRVDWWGIRTNMRYFPLLQLAMPGKTKIDFQQIEVNFLQLVLYPNRLLMYNK